MNPGGPVRVGLVGLGRMGQNHLRVLSLLADSDLAFIFDTDSARARELGERFETSVVDNLDDSLRDVEALIIATPTTTHATYIRKAIERVPNLFIEKPMTDTLEGALALRDSALVVGANIQIGYIERFNPAVEQMKRLLDQSDHVVSVDFVRTNKLSSRIDDVDVITDLMIHDIDLALYLNGPVTEVTAHGAMEGSLIGYAAALLTHENGRFSRIQASRITDKKMRTIQATCKDMFIDCELLRKEITLSRQSEVEQRPGEPYRIIGVEERLEVQPREALQLELQAFLASCRGDQTVPIPGPDDDVAAMRICEQVQRAVAG